MKTYLIKIIFSNEIYDLSSGLKLNAVCPTRLNNCIGKTGFGQFVKRQSGHLSLRNFIEYNP